MKRVLSVLVVLFAAVFLCFAGLQEAQAATTISADGYTYTIDNGEVSVKGGSSLKGEIVIPGEINGYPVTAIEPEGFDWLNITAVTIPDSVKTIGDKAFYFCTALKTVTIGTGVTSIGQDVLSYCSSLTQIQVEVGNPAYHSSGNCLIETESQKLIAGCKESVIPTDGSVKSIGAYAFYGNLREGITVTVPDSVTSIEESAFAYCFGLSAVTLGSGVESIAQNAFKSCSYLEQINIPASVKQVGSCAFSDCDKLKRVDIEDLGAWCQIDFADEEARPAAQVYLDDAQLKDIVIPQSVSRIKPYTFCGADELGTVTVLEGVTAIDAYAFFRAGVTAITIADSVTEIGARAFYYSSLASMDMGDGVTEIGEAAFYECPLTELVLGGSVKTVGNDAFSGSYITSVTLSDSVVSIGSYAFSRTPLTQLVLPDTLSQLGEYAFHGCKELAQVTIGSSLTVLPKGVFSGCTKLARIVIPDTVIIMLEGAFSGCSSLAEAVVSSNITTVHANAFSGCTALTQLQLSDSLTQIYDSAFKNCTSLKELTIPATVTYIDHYAFENCTGLEKVMISDLVAWCAIEFRIGSSNPLSNGAKLLLNGEEIKGTLTIPEGVTKVGDYAFYNYNPITELVIPDAVTEIGISAFNGCSIARLELGNGIVSVDNGAFYNCTSMQYVDIPDISFWLSISFGNRYSNPLFAAGYAKLRVGGEAVTVVKVPKEVTWIRPYVFAGYKALTDVVLYDSVKTVGEWAFYNCVGLESVWYTGTEADRESIEIASYNSYLTDADWYYGYCPVLRGDVDGDEMVNDADALYLLRFTLFPDRYPINQDGDMNGDGSVDDADALYLLRYTLFPDRYPLL